MHTVDWLKQSWVTWISRCIIVRNLAFRYGNNALSINSVGLTGIALRTSMSPTLVYLKAKKRQKRWVCLQIHCLYPIGYSPATAHGVGILTELYVKCMDRYISLCAIARCFGLGLFMNLTLCLAHWQLARTGRYFYRKPPAILQHSTWCQK